MPALRAVTLLNEMGDTTIVWTQDRDDEMERIIEKKMAEGVAFYMIEPRFGTRERLADARDANRHRMLAIPDSDFAAFVGGATMPADGARSAAVETTPKAPAKSVRRAKTAREVASGESIGVRQRRGG